MRIFLLLFLFLALSNVRALPVQQTDSTKKTVATILDSSKVELRKINESAVGEYSKQKEFSYDDAAPKTLSWWDRFWKAFWDFIRSIFSSKGEGRSIGWLPLVLKYFTIALAIGLIVFAVIKLLKLDLKLLFGKSKGVDVPYEESLENIHEIDFSEQLERALQNKNYRLGVRLLYLETLKHLTDRALINWQPEKTNQTYVEELAQEKHRNDFSELTYQFEYIWYGDFAVDEPKFEILKGLFHQFKQLTK